MPGVLKIKAKLLHVNKNKRGLTGADEVSRTTSIKKGIYIQPMNHARIQIHSVCLSPSERSQTALKFYKET